MIANTLALIQTENLWSNKEMHEARRTYFVAALVNFLQLNAISAHEN